jgi:hypothetical protein
VILLAQVQVKVNQHGKGDPGDWFANIDPLVLGGAVVGILLGGMLIWKLFLSK